MKTIDEIKKDGHLRGIQESSDGFTAAIHIGGWDGSLVFSYGAGWEHVSVAPFAKRIVPGWNEMCQLKDIFFNDNEAVIEIHPPKDMYVNNKSNCLHLWRCTYKDMVLPPSCLVGVRKGQTMAELQKEIREAYEMAGETY